MGDGVSRRDVLLGAAVVAAAAGCSGEPERVAHPQEDEDVTYTDPMVLSAQVSVSPNSGDAAPSAQLANPHDIPIELLACRFMITPTPAAGDTLTAYQITGAQVGVKLDLGAVPVADTAVPISILGTVRDTYENLDLVEAANAELVQPSLYAWRLKYPLLIPPHRTLACAITTLAQITTPFTFSIAYLCRTWDTTKQVPRTVKVPWVASYKSKTFDYLPDAPGGHDNSKVLDLLNPHKTDLEITRLGGRISFGAVGSYPTTRSYTVEEMFQYRTLLGRLRMRSSRGFDLVRTPTPFDGVFPLNWRAWEIPGSWLMAPGESYRAQLDVSPVTSNPSPAKFTGSAQFELGLVGYRNVPSSVLFGGGSP